MDFAGLEPRRVWRRRRARDRLADSDALRRRQLGHRTHGIRRLERQRGSISLRNLTLIRDPLLT